MRCGLVGVYDAKLGAILRLGPESAARWEALRQLVPAGMPPAHVADAVFHALRNDQFYILTHPEGKEAVRARMEDILQERTPAPPGL